MALSTNPPSLARHTLLSLLEAGSTGCVHARGVGGQPLAVYVMLGEILAAHSADDRERLLGLLANGGLVESARVEALRRAHNEGSTITEELFEFVPEDALQELLAERFRENLFEYLRSSGEPSFEALESVFVENIQVGHDSRALVDELERVAVRTARLREPPGLVLAPGAGTMKDPAQLKMASLCRPRLPIGDLIARSPWEPSRTLTLVAELLERGGLVAVAAREDTTDRPITRAPVAAKVVVAPGRPESTRSIERRNSQPRDAVAMALANAVSAAVAKVGRQREGHDLSAPPPAPLPRRETAPPPESRPGARSPLDAVSAPMVRRPPVAPAVVAETRRTDPPAFGARPLATARTEPPASTRAEPPRPPVDAPRPSAPPARPSIPPEARVTLPPAPAEVRAPTRPVDAAVRLDPPAQPAVRAPAPPVSRPAAPPVAPGRAPDPPKSPALAVFDEDHPTEEIDEEMAAFQDYDYERVGGEFVTETQHLDRVELVPVVPVVPEAPAARGLPLADPTPNLTIEMEDAEHATRAELASAVALNFAGPKLEETEARRKLEVVNEVFAALAEALDRAGGSGAGQSQVQLLVEGTPGAFSALFKSVEVDHGGQLPLDTVLKNLRKRPASEHRRILNRGLADLIERALSMASEDLDDAALEQLLERVAGYQQRLGM